MSATFGRTCSILALGIALAVAVSVGLKVQHDGIIILAHTASMQLQGGADEDAVASDADGKPDRIAARAARGYPELEQKLVRVANNQERVFALMEASQAHERKGSPAWSDEVRPKSID
jgi:hypothetical protein